jgi:hypothetical protein
MVLRFLAFLVVGLTASSFAGEDTITLQDGKTVVGQIIKDEAQSITVQFPDGEQRAILKTKIARIVRVGVPGGPAPKAIAGMAVKQPAGAAPNTPPHGPMKAGDQSAQMEIIKKLGAAQPNVRRSAMDEIVRNKETLLPVMLGMLNPKLSTDEYTRMGILRSLVYCLPLPDQAAETIGFAALYDPYPEVRREACVTIRALSDDRAIRVIMKQALTENPKERAAVAAALHEIDDSRVLLGLIRALPQPSVTANYEENPRGLEKPAQYLPVGPGGATIPIFLPQGGVSGVATDLDSPLTYLLKQIAGKDMGNLHYGWFNWYREKQGEIGQLERDSERENRSMRDRMNR